MNKWTDRRGRKGGRLANFQCGCWELVCTHDVVPPILPPSRYSSLIRGRTCFRTASLGKDERALRLYDLMYGFIYAEGNANGKFCVVEDLSIKDVFFQWRKSHKMQKQRRKISDYPSAASKRQQQIPPRHLSTTVRPECRLYSASSVLLLSAFLVSTLTFGGMAASSLPFPDPSRLPMMPIGLGTGHSLAFLIDSSFWSSSVTLSSSEMLSSWPWSAFRRRLRLRLRPSSDMEICSPSAKASLGAGQGMIWGIPTTRKETRSVVPSREVVVRERGCRWGGIVACPQNWRELYAKGQTLVMSISWSVSCLD